MAAPSLQLRAAPLPRTVPHPPLSDSEKGGRLRLPWLLACLALAGCAAHRDPWSGPWKPVNHLDATPRALPLQSLTAFYAAPLDHSLKGLLERWTRDANLQLEWRLQEDYTLSAQATSFRAGDIRAALEHVNALYAGLKVTARLQGDRIIVERPAPAAEGSSP